MVLERRRDLFEGRFKNAEGLGLGFHIPLAIHLRWSQYRVLGQGTRMPHLLPQHANTLLYTERNNREQRMTDSLVLQ